MTSSMRWRELWFLGAMLALGCGGTAEDPGETSKRVTFWQDVAPIYYERCVSCHQEGGVGPFRLDTYESAKFTAAAAAYATAERIMPPWRVVDDGSCGTFQGSQALSDEEIATIGAWAKSGMAEGTPRADLRVTPQPKLEGETVNVSTPVFTPQTLGGPLTEHDEYRCFVVGQHTDTAKFMTGYEVEPGNRALAHHLVLFTIDPDQVVGPNGRTNQDVIQDLDNESPERAGWTCFGGAGDGVATKSMLVTWTPGQGATELPGQSGLRIAKDDLLVIQMHYILTNPEVIGQSDQTTVRMRLQDQVEHEALFLLPDLFLSTINNPTPDSLEPRKESVLYTWDMEMDGLLTYMGANRLKLYGVFPHMHRFGRNLLGELVTPSGDECIVDVHHWSYSWQGYYFYEEPFELTRNTSLRVTCDFDTRDSMDPVTPGWGTDNEMCLLGLYVVK